MMAVTTEARVHSNMHRWNLAMLACLFAVLTQCGGNGHCKFISEDFDLLSIHPEHLNERLCPFRPHLWPTNGEIGYNFPSIIRCPIGLAPVLAGNPFSSCCSPESVLISRNIDTPEKTPEYVGFRVVVGDAGRMHSICMYGDIHAILSTFGFLLSP